MLSHSIINYNIQFLMKLSSQPRIEQKLLTPITFHNKTSKPTNAPASQHNSINAQPVLVEVHYGLPAGSEAIICDCTKSLADAMRPYYNKHFDEFRPQNYKNTPLTWLCSQPRQSKRKRTVWTLDETDRIDFYQEYLLKQRLDKNQDSQSYLELQKFYISMLELKSRGKLPVSR